MSVNMFLRSSRPSHVRNIDEQIPDCLCITRGVGDPMKIGPFIGICLWRNRTTEDDIFVHFRSDTPRPRLAQKGRVAWWSEIGTMTHPMDTRFM